MKENFLEKLREILKFVSLTGSVTDDGKLDEACDRFILLTLGDGRSHFTNGVSCATGNGASVAI